VVVSLYFFDWRSENRVKNKNGFIFAAIFAPHLANCFRQGAVITALKKIVLEFGFNPANPNYYPVHYVVDLEFEFNLCKSVKSVVNQG